MTPEMNPRKRRARSTPPAAEKPAVVKRRQRRRKIGNAFAMLLMLALVALLIVISPKTPVTHAYFTIGTEDNQVTLGNGASQAYAGLVISEVMTSTLRVWPMR